MEKGSEETSERPIHLLTDVFMCGPLEQARLCLPSFLHCVLILFFLCTFLSYMHTIPFLMAGEGSAQPAPNQRCTTEKSQPPLDLRCSNTWCYCSAVGGDGWPVGMGLL